MLDAIPFLHTIREAAVAELAWQPPLVPVDGNGARLIYADWLDERGECARAELIRVQCAQHVEDGCPHGFPRVFNWFDVVGCGQCSWCKLRRRAIELSHLPEVSASFGQELYLLVGDPTEFTIHVLVTSFDCYGVVQRGLLEHVGVPWDYWLNKLAPSPNGITVHSVALTTTPRTKITRVADYPNDLLREVVVEFIDNGHRESFHAHLSERLSGLALAAGFVSEAIRRMTKVRWPGIEFYFPNIMRDMVRNPPRL